MVPPPPGWAQYFEDLATPVDNPEFDEAHRKTTEMMYLLLRQQEMKSPKEILEITPDQVVKHMKSLKNNKAADIFGVTAQHMKLASEEIVPNLTKISNATLQEQKHPSIFKVGKITPVLKKGKLAKETNIHRITVSSLVGKTPEKEVPKRTIPILQNKHSKLQFGFHGEVFSNTLFFYSYRNNS